MYVYAEGRRAPWPPIDIGTDSICTAEESKGSKRASLPEIATERAIYTASSGDQLSPLRTTIQLHCCSNTPCPAKHAGNGIPSVWPAATLMIAYPLIGLQVTTNILDVAGVRNRADNAFGARSQGLFVLRRDLLDLHTTKHGCQCHQEVNEPSFSQD